MEINIGSVISLLVGVLFIGCALYIAFDLPRRLRELRSQMSAMEDELRKLSRTVNEIHSSVRGPSKQEPGQAPEEHIRPKLGQ
jgi:HAMP domain-containing protein